MSEMIPFEDARKAIVDARRDEVFQLEDFIEQEDDHLDAEVMRRYTTIRRIAIVAMSVRRPEGGDL